MQFLHFLSNATIIVECLIHINLKYPGYEEINENTTKLNRIFETYLSTLARLNFSREKFANLVAFTNYWYILIMCCQVTSVS